MKSIQKNIASVLIVLVIVIGVIITTSNFEKFQLSGNSIIPEWISTQKLIQNGADPYSKSAQNYINGYIHKSREVTEGEPKYQFSHPIYALLLLFPIALISNAAVVKIIFIGILFITSITFTFLSLKITQIHKTKKLFYPILILSLTSIQHFLAFQTNGFSIFTSVFLIWGVYLFTNQKFFKAGIVFSFATIVPSIAWSVIIFSIIWSISNRKETFIIGFIAGVTSLISIGLLFQPNWIISYISATGSQLILNNLINITNLINSQISFGIISLESIIIIGLVALLFLEWLSSAKLSIHSYIWTVGISISIATILSFNIIAINQVFLLFPITILVSSLKEKWNNIGINFSIILIILIYCIGWGSYLYLGPNNPVLILYLPIISIIGLYWVRHWNRNTYEKYTVPNKHLRALKKF